MSTHDEKRRSERSCVIADVQVRCASGVILEGKARDLSMRGVWFDTEDSLPVRHPVRVEIAAGKGESFIHAVLEGTVARTGEGGLAIEFGNITPEAGACLDALLRGQSVLALA